MHEHLHFLNTFQLLRKNVVHVSNNAMDSLHLLMRLQTHMIWSYT